MDTLSIKYCTYARALPPQSIRLTPASWAGLPQKMENGSEPQPWHCLPFVEASTYGFELLYPYETECHVVTADNTIHFEWDFAKEPGGGVTGGEFRAFSPLEASRYYLFNTRLDLQPPPGYVLRTEPHPRYFTDETGTVPLSMIGHLQNEWYPRLLFVVFRAPPPGSRHTFRKGEPFAQVIFVPHRQKLESIPMTVEEAAERRRLEAAIETSRLDIAENVWRNPHGYAFNNHYKVLARAFARNGLEGVKGVVEEAIQAKELALQSHPGIAEKMALGAQWIREQKFERAEELYRRILNHDSQNAGAYAAMGVALASQGNITEALAAMTQAVALQPGFANYQLNLGELLRRQNRLAEAEASFRSALRLTPNDPEVLTVLGLVLAQQGRAQEALDFYRAALTFDARLPAAHFGMGQVLAQQGQRNEARASYEAALAVAPDFVPARQALDDLDSGGRS